MLLRDELDRQAETLLGLGYDESLRDAAKALGDPLGERLGDQVELDRQAASFVLVPGPRLMPISKRVPKLHLGDRPGTLSRHFADVDEFQATVEVPDLAAYAVVGVQRGDEFLGVRPAEAAATLADRSRTMLTMAEGIAFLHAVPEALEKNHCFHTGGSRGTDKRVPALWISERAPHLGWCWENNHHTWLGMASAEDRIAAA